MRKCIQCGRYTLRDRCPTCGGETKIPHPPKFSPHDKYARLRVSRKPEEPIIAGEPRRSNAGQVSG